MSHLQQLINKIKDDAESEATAIIKQAKEERETLIQAKEMQAQEDLKIMIKRAKGEAKNIVEQAISNATICVRDKQLKAKGDVIDRVFQLTLTELLNLNDDLYVTFLKNRLNDMTLKGNELLVVAEEKSELVKSQNLPIKLSEDHHVDSGFHLIDGKITANHSFESILDYYEDDLQLVAAQTLFTE